MPRHGRRLDAGELEQQLQQARIDRRGRLDDVCRFGTLALWLLARLLCGRLSRRTRQLARAALFALAGLLSLRAAARGELRDTQDRSCPSS